MLQLLSWITKRNFFLGTIHEINFFAFIFSLFSFCELSYVRLISIEHFSSFMRNWNSILMTTLNTKGKLCKRSEISFYKIRGQDIWNEYFVIETDLSPLFYLGMRNGTIGFYVRWWTRMRNVLGLGSQNLSRRYGFSFRLNSK